MIRSEAHLADHQRPAHQRLRLRVQRFRVKQQPKLVHQPHGRFRDSSGVRLLGHAKRMRGERIETWPSPHVLRVADEGGIQPPERLGYSPA